MQDELNDCVQNAPERPEYAKVLNVLKPVLHGLPAVVVAIDGRSGVGKTTLGRFLSWRFNMSLLESDLFIDKEQAGFQHRTEDVRKVIEARLEKGHPVIVEGITALSLLDEAGFTPNFHIRVQCDEVDVTPQLEKVWENYLSTLPRTNLDTFTLNLPVLAGGPAATTDGYPA